MQLNAKLTASPHETDTEPDQEAYPSQEAYPEPRDLSETCLSQLC
jgi:hypothetical protein